MIRREESFLMLEQNWLLFELGNPLGVLLNWGGEKWMYACMEAGLVGMAGRLGCDEWMDWNKTHA
jgi:hypothetical protein